MCSDMKCMLLSWKIQTHLIGKLRIATNLYSSRFMFSLCPQRIQHSVHLPNVSAILTVIVISPCTYG